MKFSPSCTCCGEFVCEECSGDGEKIPGCATVTMNGLSLTAGTPCGRDTTFQTDLLNGQFVLQSTWDSTDEVCIFSSKGYCSCSNLNYGRTHKLEAIKNEAGSTAADFGVGFALKQGPNGGNPGYVIADVTGNGFEFGGSTPTEYIYFSATKTQSANDDCGDFPLTWLGCTVNTTNLSNNAFFLPSWTSADIVFSFQGCAGADCNAAKHTDCGDWGGHEWGALDSTGHGWCNDRAPGSYNKKADGMTFTVPDDWDGLGTTGGNVTITGEMKHDLSTNQLYFNSVSVSVGGITDVSFVSENGGSDTITLNGTESFNKTVTENVCTYNYGHPCDDMEGTYTGTHVNITSVVITEV